MTLLQVLQQYGGLFVSIQSFNTTSTQSFVAPAGRKLLAGSDSAQASDSLQVTVLVTAPAEEQVQLLSPVCPAKVAQSLTAAGWSLLLFCCISQCTVHVHLTTAPSHSQLQRLPPRPSLCRPLLLQVMLPLQLAVSLV